MGYCSGIFFFSFLFFVHVIEKVGHCFGFVTDSTLFD